MIFSTAVEALGRGLKVGRKNWIRDAYIFAEPPPNPRAIMAASPVITANWHPQLDDFTADDWEIVIE